MFQIAIESLYNLKIMDYRLTITVLFEIYHSYFERLLLMTKYSFMCDFDNTYFTYTLYTLITLSAISKLK